MTGHYNFPREDVTLETTDVTSMIARRLRLRLRSRIARIAAGIIVISTIAVGIIVVRDQSDPVSSVRHMVKTRELIGLSESELVSKFGKPVETTHFQGWNARFLLGPSDRFMAIDNSWLVVRYDDERRVVEADVKED